MIRIITFFFSALVLVQAYSQKKNSNTKPYPFGNPVVSHMYTADASPHVMPDGRVWMVTSVDLEGGGGYSTMHSYHTFSSTDMVNWADHGEVFHISDIAPNEDPKTDDYALWAPDMIYRNGKYYLYYPVHIRHRKELNENGRPKVTSYIAVAVSDAPDKKFTVLKDRIEGTRGIDPSVFLDDDGELYLYWGAHWVAKVKDNMYELATKPVKIELGIDKHFMEAPWMHKRNGKYYFNYHTLYGKPVDPASPDDPERKKSRLDWSWGTRPMGPLTYGGILNYELGYGVEDDPIAPKYPGKNYVPWRLTQSNHGGVVTFHRNDYLFYHTSAISSWRQDEFQKEGTWTQRSVCIDIINYTEDGAIIPVQQTISSVDPVVVYQPYEINLSGGGGEGVSADDHKITIKKDKASMTFENIDLGSGYYYFDLNAYKVTTGGSVEIRKGSATGQLIGTIRLSAHSPSINGGILETSLIDGYGQQDMVLVFRNLKGAELADFRFYAGSPQPHKDDQYAK